VKIHSIPFNVFGQHYVLNSSLICNLAGMLFYTVTNFIINKFYTFKS
jgi:putative flippase GtrA